MHPHLRGHRRRDDVGVSNAAASRAGAGGAGGAGLRARGGDAGVPEAGAARGGGGREVAVGGRAGAADVGGAGDAGARPAAGARLPRRCCRVGRALRPGRGLGGRLGRRWSPLQHLLGVAGAEGRSAARIDGDRQGQLERPSHHRGRDPLPSDRGLLWLREGGDGPAAVPRQLRRTASLRRGRPPGRLRDPYVGSPRLPHASRARCSSRSTPPPSRAHEHVVEYQTVGTAGGIGIGLVYTRGGSGQ